MPINAFLSFMNDKLGYFCYPVDSDCSCRPLTKNRTAERTNSYFCRERLTKSFKNSKKQKCIFLKFIIVLLFLLEGIFLLVYSYVSIFYVLRLKNLMPQKVFSSWFKPGPNLHLPACVYVNRLSPLVLFFNYYF